MNKLGFHLIGKPNEDFESCSECVHANDSGVICVLRLCVHAIGYLYECYEKKEQKTGKWQKYEGRFDYNWECSECGCSAWEKTDYCAHCGARMVGEEE